MFFLLSGEGVTDMGAGQAGKEVCEGEDFLFGPMAMIVAQIVEARHHYSILDGACGFVSENVLAQRAAELKAAKKKLRLPGKKREKETRYFYNNARLLSRIAKAEAAARKDDVVGVLFRDADTMASAGRGSWAAKRQSMLDGFDEEDFVKGVPMVPKPKSEAWLICALKTPPYLGCNSLEDRSGNDASPKSLKKELAKLLQREITPALLCEKVRDSIDARRITMPSFNAFRDRLEEVI
ncbi:MAG TPA: hypothetical protein VJ783_02110 [Pirellulales bacterium]|nr:hypothetical protein [Pirellulales bacterium]